MPRRPPLALALLVLVAGCSSGSGSASTATGAVAVASVDGLAPVATTACRAFKAALPKELDPGVGLRVTTPASDTTAAWGDPAITLRCGVAVGNPLDEPFTFDEVHWAMHDDGASRRWTTLDRKVNVAVVVPDSYDSQAELLVTLSPAVKQALGTPAAAPGS